MILEKLKISMKEYMKEKKKIELKTVRMAISALNNKRIELKKEELTDLEEISVLKKELKGYKESLDFAKKAENKNLINELNISINTIGKYLPKEMSRDEAKTVIEKILRDNGITTCREKGKAMKTVIPILKGKLDGKVINEIVGEILK